MSRRNDEHGGYPVDGRRRRLGEGAEDLLNNAVDTPVDLAAVQADDALLDMLGGAGPAPGGSGDADLSRILVAWRREVDAEPVGELVDTDTALAVISAARRPAPRRHPLLAPVAAAAAVLVVAFSGVGVVAKSAEPGDRLWGLTKVLYADYARSTEAVQTVRSELNEAQTALQQNNPQQARESLNDAEQKLSEVQDSDEKTKLNDQRQRLVVQLSGLPSASAEPGAPPPSSEDRNIVAPPSSTPPGAPVPGSSSPQPSSPPPTSPTPSEPPLPPVSSNPTPPPSTPPSVSSEPGPLSPTPRTAPTTPEGSSTVAPAPTS